ncbi:MAG: AAA family ATPase [Solobacterium sp.]|nr:AAA family ATPase [Solobacterium sp.]
MKSFRLRNVRSFKDSGTIELKPLTIFVGKNSCGKSSLLRFPAVLSQTADQTNNSPITLNGSLIDFGNFKDVVYKKSSDFFSMNNMVPFYC